MTAAAYHHRFRRVLDHVDAHLDEDLSVERLSGVAAYSKHHFHRQFSALFGLGVHRYVQLVRFKRASYQLAFRPGARILDVALDSGYESHEAFARAFKKTVGQTPSDFRREPRWASWQVTFQPLHELRSQHMTTAYGPADVKILDFEETPIAVLEHRGDPARVGQTVRRFIEWRKQNDLPPSVSATYNLLYGPEDVAPEDFRLDICAATRGPVADNPQGVVAKTIPAGRCAVLRHVGSESTLFSAVSWLYATWLPASGEEPRDFPLFLERVRFFPDVAEHEAVTDVYLPLE